MEDAYLSIAGGEIASIAPSRPDSPVVDTDQSVILPGLIDLHGHPEYNIFPAWEPPRLYPNRYVWRRDEPAYQVLVAGPMAYLEKVVRLRPLCARYAEMRALVGGVTAIQGASASYPDPSEALVRNVDLPIFGKHRARAFVDLPDATRAAEVRAAVDRREVDRIYVHLAEGVDASSTAELGRLDELGLLGPWTVIIHGTGLTEGQLEVPKEVGARLVWSPQSNLRLYGATTKVAEALRLGIEVGLGADWLPSGSRSLLDELRVARRVLEQQGLRLEPRRLVEMVTSTAARIAGLDDRLGTLRVGAPADVTVLERRALDADESVLASDASAVNLVAIGGDIAYARTPWWDALFPERAPEEVIAWGKVMQLDTRFERTHHPRGRCPWVPCARNSSLRSSAPDRYWPEDDSPKQRHSEPDDRFSRTSDDRSPVRAIDTPEPVSGRDWLPGQSTRMSSRTSYRTTRTGSSCGTPVVVCLLGRASLPSNGLLRSTTSPCRR
ncbi:MAG: amidohydrolase family protein [Acidimicrobiales bacterium]